MKDSKRILPEPAKVSLESKMKMPVSILAVTVAFGGCQRLESRVELGGKQVY